MHAFHNWVRSFVVVALAAFALPAIATEFRLTVPASAAGGDNTNFAITITNKAGINLNSFTITAPAGVTLSSVASGSSSIPAAKITATSTSISVSGISIPNNGTGTLNMTATFPPACVSKSYTWQTTAKGSLLGFPISLILDSSHSNLKTTVGGGACTANFLTQPADTIANLVITNTAFNSPPGQFVQVQLLIGGSPAPNGTAVTLTSACALSNASAATTGGIATFTGLTSAVGSACKLTASASGFAPATSNAFNVLAPAGPALGCDFAGNTDTKGGTLDPGQDSFVGTPGYGVLRAPNVSGDCGALPWAFNLDPANNTASFLAVKGTQVPAVEYVVLWNAAPIPAEGWPSTRPFVSWGVNNPVYPDDYVPALACLDDDVTLGGAVMPTIPDVPPFQGNTHAQFLPGQPAKMCVAQQGWTAPGGGLIQQWVKVIDQSDGFIRNP